MILNLIHFNKHKRIYYVPGMFSLLAIPLVFAFYASDYLKENDYRVVSLNMPPKDFFQTEEWEFYKDFEYKDVTVPVNFSNDVENQFYNLIKELQKENIDKTGIKFQLSDANTYDDIIKLLDLMEITEQGRYLINFNDNSFYVLHIKKEGNSGMDDILVMTCYVGSPKKNIL